MSSAALTRVSGLSPGTCFVDAHELHMTSCAMDSFVMGLSDYYEVGKTRRAFLGQFLRQKLPQRRIKMHEEKKLTKKRQKRQIFI